MSTAAPEVFDATAEARDPGRRVRRIKQLVDTAPHAIGADDLSFLKAVDEVAWGRVVVLRHPAAAAAGERAAEEYVNTLQALVFGKSDDARWEAKAAQFIEILKDYPWCPEVLLPFAAALHRINEKHVALATRLDEFERRPKGLSFCGAWQRAALYRRHDGVVCNGSLFVCTSDESRGVVPGSDTSWALCAKAGKDGKDR